MNPMRLIPRSARLLALCLFACAAASLAQAAQVDYFLHLEGIDGEATSMPAAGFEIHPFGESPGAMLLVPAVQKVRDAATRRSLAELACDGIVIPRVVIESARGDQQEYLKIVLTDVLVSSWSMGASASESLPMEEVSFNYARAEIDYSGGRRIAFDCTSGRCACGR